MSKTNPIDDALALIRSAHEKVGTAALARRAGLAYTTVNSARGRDFESPASDTLRALADAAIEIAAEKPVAKAS